MSVLNIKQPETLSLHLEERSGSARDEVLSIWRQLEGRVNDGSLASSADWTDVWLNVYGDLIPHRFLIAKAEDRAVGCCLITEGVSQKDGPLPIKTLHIGTAGEPDADSVCVEYNRLLVEPKFEKAFAVQIVEWLESQRGFDQWNLEGFAEEDLTLFGVERTDGPHPDPLPVSGERGLLRARGGGRGDGSSLDVTQTTSLLPLTGEGGRRPDEAAFDNIQFEVTREPTYWFDLKATREVGKDVLSEFRSSTRRKVKRSLEGFAGLEVECSESLDHATDIFGELIDLHQSRWNSVGKPGSYSSERFTRFHEELLARLVPRNRMAFVRVRSDEGTLGCVQLLIDRNRALFYQCGWATTDDKRSPGVVLDYLAMKACFERGFDAYDFLAFATQHKRHLSNRCHDIVWAKRKHPRLKFVVLDQARKVKQILKRKSESDK